MADYEIGYGKPPRGRPFCEGVSGNIKGRPKRRPQPVAEIINGALDAPIEYREAGETKVSTHRLFSLKMLVDKAIGGDVDAAQLVLKILVHAGRYGDPGTQQILVEDWMADFPGQTAEQKTADFAAQRDAKPPEWHRPAED